MSWLKDVNFQLQDVAQEIADELVAEQYHDMVQDIMAGFYQAMEVGCEFDEIVDLEN
jgi:hypothetical protein